MNPEEMAQHDISYRVSNPSGGGGGGGPWNPSRRFGMTTDILNMHSDD
jgi:hypothetical protein